MWADPRGAVGYVGAPSFARRLPVTRSAILFAGHLHRSQSRASDDAPFILHPLEVASLIYNAGAEDWLVAAGVLHDVIEDTTTVIEEIRQRFGPRVCAVVAALTEDERIEPFSRRKAALRNQVRMAGPDAMVVFAADKLAKARELRSLINVAVHTGEGTDEQIDDQLVHHRASLTMLESALPEHPLVRQFRFELEALWMLPPRAGATGW